MIEVVNKRYIFCFDGRVLEVFTIDGETRRFHIAHIRKIELLQLYNEWRLSMEYTDLKNLIRIDVEDDAVTAMENLISVVRDTLAT